MYFGETVAAHKDYELKLNYKEFALILQIARRARRSVHILIKLCNVTAYAYRDHIIIISKPLFNSF